MPGDVGAQIALAVGAVAVGAQRLHPHHAGNGGELARHVDAVRLDIDDMAAAQHLAGEFGHRAGQRQLAAVEQGHAVAHALHLVEMVRGQQHRGAVGLEVANHVEEFRRRMRIERGGRLVEHGDARPLHQDFGEAEPLAHALRIGGDAGIADIVQPDAVERRVETPVDLAPASPASRAV